MVVAQHHSPTVASNRAAMDLKSPFDAVLNNNYCASAQDVKAIAAFLVHPSARLHELDDEIEQLESRLKDCRSQRDELAGYVSSHRAPMSPIHRIPPELLAEVFTRCLPVEHIPTRSLTEAPLLLTLVCKTWREICLTTPRLWSALHIYIPHLHCKRFTQTMLQRKQGVEEWFARSGDTPLSLSLFPATEVLPPSTDVLKQQYKQETAVYKALITSLSQHASKWVHLELRVVTSILETFGRLRPEDLPLLRSLKLDCSSWTIPWDAHLPDGHCLDNLLQAPSLCAVNLREHIVHPLMLPIPWHRLVVVSLQTHIFQFSMTTLELFTALSQTTVLETCYLTIKVPAPYEPIAIDSDVDSTLDSEGVLELSKLESLFLSFAFESPDQDYFGLAISGNVIESVFQKLVIPSLRKLSVQITAGPAISVMHHVPFLSLLDPSRPSGTQICTPSKIQVLDIVLPITTEAMLESLRLMPSLRHLSVAECPWKARLGSSFHDETNFIFNDAFLRELTPTEERPIPLVPNLETLSIGDCQTISERVLVEFIKAKQQRGTEDLASTPPGLFRSISVRYDREMKDDIMHEVACLQSPAFHIYITFHPKPCLDSPWAGLESMTWLQSAGVGAGQSEG
ncbi:hypothetical protein D9758_001524 [Tetrapyrgos nigripes]|uniref:F-box domain-containing protein n=1 Tax=Tetrapyrgos nigripes TaxID=182062 RepID=A0A8H5GXI0_9AGAR|nr:hypothetical protein D9758_001524 [Tetrapyrgos nigripes]